MKIIEKLDFLQTSYSTIIKQYGFIVQVQSEHFIRLENSHVTVDFMTERYDPDPNALGLYIRGKKIKKGWLIYDIYMQMGFETPTYLSKEEFDHMLDLPDGISRIIFKSALFLEHFGEHILMGDFSIMGKEWINGAGSHI